MYRFALIVYILTYSYNIENRADNIILKIIQLYYKNEFLVTVSEKKYRKKNEKAEAIRRFYWIMFNKCGRCLICFIKAFDRINHKNIRIVKKRNVPGCFINVLIDRYGKLLHVCDIFAKYDIDNNHNMYDTRHNFINVMQLNVCELVLDGRIHDFRMGGGGVRLNILNKCRRRLSRSEALKY